MNEYEAKLSETICTEFTVSKKKWFCLSVYKPPSPNTIVTFCEQLTDSLSKAINSYDNIILMGDFNIDIKKENSTAYDKLEEFWHRSGVFIVNFEHISYLVLVFLLLTLNMQLPTGIDDLNKEISDSHMGSFRATKCGPE